MLSRNRFARGVKSRWKERRQSAWWFRSALFPGERLAMKGVQVETRLSLSLSPLLERDSI